MGVSPVGVYCGGLVFVGVGGRAVWDFSPLEVATAATLASAAAVKVWGVCRLAVTAAAACIPVCEGARRCPDRCRSPRWPRW